MAMDMEDVEKTAIISEYGLYEWNVMPQGLCNVPSSFQNLMDIVLSGLSYEVCLTFSDDIICFSEDVDTHIDRLGMIFDRLLQANLKLKANKCKLFKPEVEYLGYKVSSMGLTTCEDKIAAIQRWRTPTCVKE